VVRGNLSFSNHLGSHQLGSEIVYSCLGEWPSQRIIQITIKIAKLTATVSRSQNGSVTSPP
jgi:hypothetical protein